MIYQVGKTYKMVNGGLATIAGYANKNDKGWTFAEIADYIERTWNPDDKETV